MKKLIYLFINSLIFSCTDENAELDSTNNFELINSRFIETPMVNISLDLSKNNYSLKGSTSSTQFMADVNKEFRNQGISIQLYMMEYYSSNGAGNTVYFNNKGNKQLGADFVPGDSRRGGFTDIAYARDGTEGATASGLTQDETDAAILSAMDTWNNVSCSKGLKLTDLGASPFDLGYVQALVTNGASGSYLFTDVMHSGFNTEVTDAVFGPESDVLGVTFTFVWTDDITEIPTDIDNNKKKDVAFRDIYYNDAFSWAIGDHIDVETIALHESGHGLSQAHFGTVFISGGNNKVHFSPRAVMNAGYSGIQTTINKSDKAGHCSIWGNWPYN